MKLDIVIWNNDKFIIGVDTILDVKKQNLSLTKMTTGISFKKENTTFLAAMEDIFDVYEILYDLVVPE